VVPFYYAEYKAIAHRQEVVEAFKTLYLTSEDFRNSIESTTKSIRATYTRLFMWGTKLKEVTGLDFKVPRLEYNRIQFARFW